MKHFKQGKLIGEVNDRMFTKNITESKHLMKKFGNVPAIDKELWDSVKDEVDTIQITTDQKRIFFVDTSVFNENRIMIDYGFGAQYVLPFEFWQIL